MEIIPIYNTNNSSSIALFNYQYQSTITTVRCLKETLLNLCKNIETPAEWFIPCLKLRLELCYPIQFPQFCIRVTIMCFLK